MKFGSMTDNGIGKSPLNFGHDPEEILSVSTAQLVGFVAASLLTFAICSVLRCFPNFGERISLVFFGVVG